MAWVKAQPPLMVSLSPGMPYLGVKAKEMTEGLEVEATVPEGAAAEAGIKPGDLLWRVDGRRVVERDALVRLVAAHAVGDKVKVEYRRDGRYESLEATLKALPAK